MQHHHFLLFKRDMLKDLSIKLKTVIYDVFKLTLYALWFCLILITIGSLYYIFSAELTKYTLSFVTILIATHALLLLIWKKYHHFGLSDVNNGIRHFGNEIIAFGKGVATLFIVLIIIAVLIAIVWFLGVKVFGLVNNVFKDKTWTLMVCEERLNRSECMTNSYIIPGFKTQNECMLEGAKSFNVQGFECGRSCRKSEGLQLCDIICNKSGCNE